MSVWAIMGIVIAAVVAAAAVTAWLIARWHLSGIDLSAFDRPEGRRFNSRSPASPELQEVLGAIQQTGAAAQGLSGHARTKALRDAMDQLSAGRDLDAQFTPTQADGVPAEWVCAPDANPARRLLYVHGGAFMLGSPRSHRSLTSALSKLADAAVLAIDYRLMPEHPRMAGVHDTRSAYRWLLANGPDGPAAPERVFVAGDSAGGNLVLSLLAWVRDQGLRLPDAGVALAPLADSTLASPSLRSNLATDPLVGPQLGGLLKLPRSALLLGSWFKFRVNPSDPVVSPVYANLAGLPPVLVQVSNAEMLRDDGRRWVNRARAAGSAAHLQVFEHMPHVWQLFNPELPEACRALEEVGKFLADAGPATPD